MLEKRWVNLKVDSITPVKWNVDAFKSIAMDDDDKHLGKALVSTKLDKDKRTDVIDGKGNEPIILLHDGPGTGKTITADGVTYLETVFHLGKIWDCVVLLDGADVFLEQRSLQNLQRNTLVLVFLWVLEYHRAPANLVQLVNRLETLNEEIYFDDIRARIHELASYPMNGRQIRNSISTAKQLTMYKKKKMRSKDLVYVIRVAETFKNHLLAVKDNVADDDWAREECAR
ncbi:hypothetical protein K469DRAFT_730299 [Zopfia rhizophila CBS 207.26]|uniref:ATPase AAA-type core domain-containing protein n=1 Tax=Zopfia rhizophila CBS 207.26 TaxID=1314779 RepID=A0A6A6DKH3_9PEZI|nr:hypothetical protein K469DRAFT_730299 [Zopfia rhizophila CBS 207.26]